VEVEVEVEMEVCIGGGGGVVVTDLLGSARQISFRRLLLF
jgi:hypothetical protein